MIIGCRNACYSQSSVQYALLTLPKAHMCGGVRLIVLQQILPSTHPQSAVLLVITDFVILCVCPPLPVGVSNSAYTEYLDYTVLM